MSFPEDMTAPGEDKLERGTHDREDGTEHTVLKAWIGQPLIQVCLAEKEPRRRYAR